MTVVADEGRATGDAAGGALFESARRLYIARQYDDALKAAQQLLAYEAFVARAYSVRALCLTEMWMAAEGLAAAEAAVATDARDAVAITSRAFCRHRLGDDAGAEKDYAAALALAPGDFRVYYNLACYWSERGDEARCREYLARAVDLVPPASGMPLAEDADLARYHQREWFRELSARAKAKDLRK